jgi:hypothetical protein
MSSRYTLVRAGGVAAGGDGSGVGTTAGAGAGGGRLVVDEQDAADADAARTMTASGRRMPRILAVGGVLEGASVLERQDLEIE